MQAAKGMERSRQLEPKLRLTNLKDLVAQQRPEHLAKREGGLRRAGLPKVVIQYFGFSTRESAIDAVDGSFTGT